jgi:transcriptional regulator with XRE-family HTH domain
MNSGAVHTAVVTLAERIRSAVNAQLAQRGISQRELARRLGWSQQYTWRRLAGRQEFSPTDLDQIASALDLPVDELVPGNPAEVA